VKPSSTSRQAAVEREPARKHRPARAGTAPREGKSSEGRLQERERHGIRPPSVGASRPTACSARGTLRREAQPEPSRGARTLRTAPARDRRSLVHREASRRSAVKRGTRRRCVRGSKKPRRGGSRTRETLRPLRRFGAEKESGRRSGGRTLKRSRTPREGLSELTSRESARREKPQAGRNGEGGAPGATKALLDGLKNSGGGGNLTRGRTGRGRPRSGHRRVAQSLEG
jgi:hypothetical protein